MRRRWVHLYGDGAVYQGACLVHSITLWPEANQDYTRVYDGRDVTSGKMFVELQAATRTNVHVTFEGGVPFDQGIYVNGKDAEVQTTIVFTPTEC